VGKPLARIGHGDADRQAEQGPETVDPVAGEMDLMPLDEKVADHDQDKQGEEKPFQYGAALVEVFEYFLHQALLMAVFMGIFFTTKATKSTKKGLKKKLV
jgi:hypothetical protein